MTTHDLVVIGGGPVGLAAALHARDRGLDVVVVERRRAWPIDKACGEGIMPAGLRELRRLGVDPSGMPFTAIRYVSPEHEAHAPLPDAPGRGVRRTVLHTALADAAARRGVPVVTGAAAVTGQDATGVDVVVARPHERGGGVALRAGHVIAADGLHSPTRRRLGLQLPARGARRVGLVSHARVAPWTDAVEVHWSPVAEAYVTPLGPDLVGVALLSSRASSSAGFGDLLAACPRLAQRLAGAQLGPVLGAGPLRQPTRRRTAGRVLLVGDAAGYVDALTGEGISLGLVQARLAVAAVARGRPTAYEIDWLRATTRPLLLTELLVRAAGSPLRPALVPAAARLPRVFTGIVGALAR